MVHYEMVKSSASDLTEHLAMGHHDKDSKELS
jgi:hypothetical protein